MHKKEEFYDKVVRGIREKLGEDFAVDVREVLKVNITLDGLTILYKEDNISPTIYLNRYRDDFDAGRPLEDIIEDILEVYESNRNPEHISVQQFFDFDKLKDKIIIKVISSEKNKRLLEKIPHVLIGDLELAAIPYVMLENRADGSMGFQIQNSHLEMWGKSLSDIMPLAAANTNKMYRFVVKSMTEMLFNIVGSDMFWDEEDVEMSSYDEPLYVLTTLENKILGASQLYLKDKIREFSTKCDSNLYILPSSIHELILIREDFVEYSVQELKEMVQDVNESTVTEEEFLSDNVYYYDKEMDEIRRL